MATADRIIWTIVVLFGIVMLTTVGVLLFGLYDHRVDNAEIFKIIGPSFNQISGVFGAILGAKFMGAQGNKA